MRGDNSITNSSKMLSYIREDTAEKPGQLADPASRSGEL